jgi:hypothetical protein
MINIRTMKKFVYLTIVVMLFYGFASSYAKADFNPDSQVIVDFGNLTDAQISSATEGTTVVTDTPDSFNWLTSDLETLAYSMSTIDSSIDWSSIQ